ncbi:MAG: MliC family protein [Candidatus Paceibacterota bacterium]
MNTKNLLIAVVIIILLGAGYFWLTSKNNAEKIAYTSDVFTFADAGKEFTIQYNNDSSKAEVIFDNKKYELNVAISGSGARYTSPNESVIFWEHQGTASLEIDGQMVFQDAPLLKGGEGTLDMSL